MAATKRKMGRPKGSGAATNEQRRARGTYRADRHGPPKEAPPARKAARWKPLTEAQLRGLVREIPGYDPFALAAGFRLDCDRANRALAFFPEQLCHIEGALAGKPFRLERWQQAVVANLFGWVRWSPKWRRWVRRYRESLLYVPRKNGKTPLVAGIGLYVLLEDFEPGQQDYLAASTREQAGRLFRYAKGMVNANGSMTGRCRVYGGTAQAGQAKSIVKLPEETSFLQVIAADADAQHGGTGHLLLIDELHTQPDRGLVDTLGTSMASENRAEPLMLLVTTADFDRPSICNEKHDYASKVRDGVIADPRFLPVIFEAPRDADWTDPEVWARANPNLGVSVSRDYLDRECQRAKDVPAYENTFRRLHLNQKTETDARAIDLGRWDACPALAREEALAGKACYGALDLSTTTDLTAWAMLFPQGEGKYALLLRLYAPRENARVRSRRDRVPYEVWAQQGWLTLTEGDVVDYEVVRRDVNADRQRFDIREAAADRWNATQLLTQLAGDGLEVVAFGQGFQSMTAPTKELLALVTAGRLDHGGNPALRWMASNLAVEQDAAGNLKPSKKKSADRIDGCVALIMALGRAMLAPPPVVPHAEVW